jgi:hypothetical protein
MGQGKRIIEAVPMTGKMSLRARVNGDDDEMRDEEDEGGYRGRGIGPTSSYRIDSSSSRLRASLSHSSNVGRHLAPENVIHASDCLSHPGQTYPQQQTHSSSGSSFPSKSHPSHPVQHQPVVTRPVPLSFSKRVYFRYQAGRFYQYGPACWWDHPATQLLPAPALPKQHLLTHQSPPSCPRNDRVIGVMRSGGWDGPESKEVQEVGGGDHRSGAEVEDEEAGRNAEETREGRDEQHSNQPHLYGHPLPSPAEADHSRTITHSSRQILLADHQSAPLLPTPSLPPRQNSDELLDELRKKVEASAKRHKKTLSESLPSPPNLAPPSLVLSLPDAQASTPSQIETSAASHPFSISRTSDPKPSDPSLRPSRSSLGLQLNGSDAATISSASSPTSPSPLNLYHVRRLPVDVRMRIVDFSTQRDDGRGASAGPPRARGDREKGEEREDENEQEQRKMDVDEKGAAAAGSGSTTTPRCSPLPSLALAHALQAGSSRYIPAISSADSHSPSSNTSHPITLNASVFASFPIASDTTTTVSSSSSSSGLSDPPEVIDLGSPSDNEATDDEAFDGSAAIIGPGQQEPKA